MCIILQQCERQIKLTTTNLTKDWFLSKDCDIVYLVEFEESLSSYSNKDAIDCFEKVVLLVIPT